MMLGQVVAASLQLGQVVAASLQVELVEVEPGVRLEVASSRWASVLLALVA